MNTRLGFLSLIILSLASCEKERKMNTPADSQEHPRSESSSLAEQLSASDRSWEQLTGQEMLEQLQSNGITGVPRHVSRQILDGASSQGTADDQVDFILKQAEAWKHVDRFRKKNDSIPDNQKQYLVQMLTENHGHSWPSIAAEIDEQVAASDQVMQLRQAGIPGMTGEESEALIMAAMERCIPDYKAVLEIVRKNTPQ